MLFFRSKRKSSSSFSLMPETKQGIWILLLVFASVFLVLSYFDRAGEAGQVLSLGLFVLIGQVKWALPLVLVLSALFLFEDQEKSFDSANLFGLFLFIFSLSALFYFWLPFAGGGLLGQLSVEFLLPAFGAGTLAVIFSVALIISLLLTFDTSLSRLLGKESVLFWILKLLFGILLSPFVRHGHEEGGDDETGDEADDEEELSEEKITNEVKEYAVESEGSEKKRAQETENARAWSRTGVQMDIPFDLLNAKTSKPRSGDISKNQEIIKNTLRDFGVPAVMGEICVGPTVTQYTFKPAKGIPVSRVKSLADDLALNLALHPVRIEAPIPGRSLVGLEVPNQSKITITLRELLSSEVFKNRKSNTMLALGRDVTGKIWLDDLAKMPHLLVAGQTGSGKSVCLHSLIMSLIFQNNPDDLKFILIDPKQVELVSYNTLPYLIAPVVTENARAVRALKWAIREMEKRLAMLGEMNCQNIEEYNKKKSVKSLPRLVIVVDELGDLLSTTHKEAESAIIRLGQKARAAGIHLILATQRPTVDVISGLIKANIPGRIAFSVTSNMNSKTILEHSGAENLLGSGDMLFINGKMSQPVRLQGAYVGKQEIRAVVRFVKQKAGRADYIEEVTGKEQANLYVETDEVDDELMDQAKELIQGSKKASATMLQSRLAIGYPRANRILDIFEKQGLVGPSIQNKPREVYLDR